MDASRRRRAQEQLDLQEKNAQLQQALARAERDLLRAQSAELRGTALRVDGLLAQATSQDELQALETERQNVGDRLQRTMHAHQAALAREIGFRGDFGFLMRWEGTAGGVRLLSTSVFIDPATDLAYAQPDVIRSRYELVLTPAELQAVLAVTGKRDDEARAAYAAHPVLERIRLGAADVARLVPEVAAPWWQRLLERHQAGLQAVDTPGAVHTALLSFAFTMGGGLGWSRLDPLIKARQWADLADAIEQLPLHPVMRQRRSEEAALIRTALTDSSAEGGG